MPEFSIVVATRNRPRQLSALLAALAQLDHPSFETIIVDDESDTPLDSVVEPFGVRLIRQKQGGPAKGRNTGVRAARAPYIAFIDDDCLPIPQWLSVLEKILHQNPGAMAGGHVVNGIPENIYSAASQYIQDIVYAHYNRDPRQAAFLTTNNMAFARNRFLAIGGLDESFPFASEDRDLCDRWRHAGFPILYEPAAVVRHLHALSLRRFWRQHFSYGRGAARFHRAAGSRGSGGVISHWSFHAGFWSWFRGAWSGARTNRALAMTGLLIVWQIANAAGYIYERFRR